MTQLSTTKSWLDTQHPALFPLAMIAAIWLAQYAVRRWLPGVWEWAANILFRDSVVGFDKALRKIWQSIPSVLSGAVVLWMASGGSLTDALLGALLGAVAPSFHELLKAAPIPYRGGKPPAADVPADEETTKP
jgi:hypothetical protein